MQLYPEFFQRLDERPDAQFYARPRLVTHIGEATSSAACALYDRLLPDGQVLDLMASCYSHLSARYRHVTGLGLNAVEMARNPAIGDYVVCDINREPSLPFADARFDGAVCTVSVQYLTRPTDVFAEVARCLKPNAPFVVTFSNRMFPTKAVLAWRTSDDAAHVRLVEHYFAASGAFSPVTFNDCSPQDGDLLYACWAYRR